MTFSMHSVMSARALAVRVAGPPAMLTPKPKRMEKTMRGSIARRLRRAEKSGTVKKLTTSVARPACSPTSAALSSVQGTGTGG